MNKNLYKHPGFAYTQPSESSEASFDAAPARQTSAPRKEDAKESPRKADGAFRTISEVADELDVQQHVLRFWETKFTQVKPLKRGGGRRYYRPEDVTLLKHIHHLLYTDGYTIKGVQKLLKGQGKQQIVARAENQNAAPVSQPKVAAVAPAQPQASVEGRVEFAPKPSKMSDTERTVLEVMLEELKALRSMVDAA